MASADFRNDPLLAALFDYWERKRGMRAMPRRRDIDPLDMPTRLLPYLQLVELGPGGRLRYRLVGTAIVDAMGRDATGRYVDEAFAGEQQDFIHRVYRAVLDARRPVYGVCRLRTASGNDLGTQRVATPLSEDDRDANMILCATIFRVGLRVRHPPPLAALTMQDSRIEVL